MMVSKPIIIVGMGRSGSTIFHKLLSLHPKVAWLSFLCDKYPDKPKINRLLLKAIDYPLINIYLKRRINPRECYDFLDFHCKGFAMSCRDLIPQDVTNKTKKQIKYIMAKILTTRRKRLLIKVTGWPRIGFFYEIFKDAKFIHIVRDGRAVVNSIINEEWWWGWRGPQNWRWGELTIFQKEEWEKYNRSFIALAAIEWKILMDAMEKAKQFICKSDFFEVKYENLCSSPLSTLKNVIEFCELDWSEDFEKSIKKYFLKNTNYRWQKELTKDQQKILQDILYEHLRKYRYL